MGRSAAASRSRNNNTRQQRRQHSTARPSVQRRESSATIRTAATAAAARPSRQLAGKGQEPKPNAPKREEAAAEIKNRANTTNAATAGGRKQPARRRGASALHFRCARREDPSTKCASVIAIKFSKTTPNLAPTNRHVKRKAMWPIERCPAPNLSIRDNRGVTDPKGAPLYG